MNQKQIIIGGIALLAVIVVAGIVFSPSGFLSVGSESPEQFACLSISKDGVRCGGSNGLWEDNTWDTLLDCQIEHDEAGNNCGSLHCECEIIRN
jgi:hypothetical protein